MSRDLENLKRLCRKLRARYGDDDALVLQLKHELDSREAIESKHQDWSIAWRSPVKSGPFRQRQDILAANTGLRADPCVLR